MSGFFGATGLVTHGSGLSAAKSRLEGRKMGNARILLIDDEPIVRRIICRYLSCIYEVHPVESASEALTLFEKGFYI